MTRSFKSVFLFALFASSNSYACAVDLHRARAADSTWTKYQKHHALRTPASLETNWSSAQPWGGANPAIWTPEAVVANAASAALALGFQQPGAQEVLVSIPAKMLYGATRPYGDGQTNASISFGNYTGKVPPVVASWIAYSNGQKSLNLRVAPLAGLQPNGDVKLAFGTGIPINIGHLQALSNGEFEVLWRSAQGTWGDLYNNHVAYLQLPGITGVLPLDFRDTVKPAQEMLANAPAAIRNFGKGGLLDPEAVSVQTPGASMTPFERMYPNNPRPHCVQGCPAGANDFGGDLHATRYSPVTGVHNQFNLSSGSAAITAVGNGDTTLFLPPNAPFKLAYICFDGRNLEAENHFGVPSGGGWHEIGDDAETVMNTLENAAPLFGYANGHPGDERIYAFGLTDVTVIRRLQPGSALVTSSGDTTAIEGYSSARGAGPASGRNYHWFAFEQPQEVCAVEWVHPCRPTPANHIGLACAP